MDIKNTIFNPKFYQHFLPSLVIRVFEGMRVVRVLQVFKGFEGKYLNS